MLKPYGEYKYSNLPWLETMPTHWIIQRAKTMFVKMNRPIQASDDVVTCFRDSTVTLRKNRRINGFTESIKEIGYQGIRQGDLVIHVMDAFAGAVGVSDSDGKGTPVYSVCVPKGDYSTYFYAYCIREMAKSGYIQSLYRGIRERSSDFRFEVFSTQLLPIPPRDEQDQIVRYLDWKVAKINKLINAKKRQIELLKEQKQAIINQAVTKGLDPDVPMKDSGVEWLGEVPSNWEVRPLKHYARSNLLALSGTTDVEYELLYLDISSVGHGYLKQKPTMYRFKDAPSRARRIVKTGDTIISAVRTYLKSMCHIDFSMNGYIVSTGFSVLTPNSIVMPQILSYVLSCDYFLNTVVKNSIGVSYPAINDDNLVSLKIALPKTLSEQQQIFERVEIETKSIDVIVDKIITEISLITEYRTRLISDVVTGKVDVRGIEVPEEIKEVDEIVYDDSIIEDEDIEENIEEV